MTFNTLKNYQELLKKVGKGEMEMHEISFIENIRLPISNALVSERIQEFSENGKSKCSVHITTPNNGDPKEYVITYLDNR